MRKILLFIFSLYVFTLAQDMTPVRIHYGGGGDWYGNKTTWKNILNKAKKELGLKVAAKEQFAKIEDPEFWTHPIAYISGHGNISFTEAEVKILRSWFEGGGFLWADDDYGMDKSFRREMKKVFPELNFTELPFSHPIYNSLYPFKKGLPKIHEHDGGPPKGFGLILDGRVICFYTFNTDISDGCEDADVHNDAPELREEALKMAVNILLFALTN